LKITNVTKQSSSHAGNKLTRNYSVLNTMRREHKERQQQVLAQGQAVVLHAAVYLFILAPCQASYVISSPTSRCNAGLQVHHWESLAAGECYADSNPAASSPLAHSRKLAAGLWG
jgi:hypothetical protein